jgi:hypothetical protein
MKQIKMNKIKKCYPKTNKLTPKIRIGWGSEYYFGPTSRVLQKVIIKIWDHTKCQQVWRNFANVTIPITTLCAGGEYGKDACQVSQRLV